jgi:hypothetical protein
MESEWRSGRVSLNEMVGVTSPGNARAHRPTIGRMTVVDVLGRAGLREGCSVDVAIVTAIAAYRKS